jgi:multiple sugar transport system substrate-binding protein
VSDWAPAALDAVSYNGGIYGVPMDFHANLWHVNMEIMAEAGLVNDDGTPILPSSPAELHGACRHGRGRNRPRLSRRRLRAIPDRGAAGPSLMWQQGANIFTEDGTATIDTEAASATR